jgi:hypothetical protein
VVKIKNWEIKGKIIYRDGETIAHETRCPVQESEK